jgi:hypothetical protein
MKALVFGLLLAMASLPSFAQPAAVIESVQTPAWLERAGKRVPLVPGMELRAGDRIATGAGSRALVKLSEGSVVKLGENGTLRLAELQPSRELFKAALQVLQGAFRFTTGIVGKGRRRDVSVRVEQVTIGIRGTDVWGRSHPMRQVVCLIEGAVEVGAEGEQAVRLDKPRQFYRRDMGKTQPVGFVGANQIAEWSKQTEIEAGKGALRRGGRFSVQLAAVDKEAAARAVRDQVRGAGYPAEVARRKAADKVVYHVRIRHLRSREEAQALADQLKGRFGVEEPKIWP